MLPTERPVVLLTVFTALIAGAGGCAQSGRRAGQVGPIPDPREGVSLATVAGFDDGVRLVSTDGDESDDPPPAEAAHAAPVVVTEPGFVDEVQIRPARERSTAAESASGSADENVNLSKGEDTDLGRSRAQRRGEGGGPTRSEEEKDEEKTETDEEFTSDLLSRALGLQDSPYNVFGWLQGSFTGNPSRPRNGESFGVNPNTLANTWLFQQLFLAVERPLDPDENDSYQLGFRIDNLFGSDWTQYHMVGLLDDLDRSKYFGWEPVQFYGEIHLPWLTRGGIDVKGGRFFSLAGYEDALAPGRPLNSASYLFGYAQPFTQFGAMTTLHLTDRLNVFNGAVSGWDRWIDREYRWGYSGGLVYDSVDGRTNATLTYSVGPNQFPEFFHADYPFTPNGVTNPPFLAGRRNILYGRDNAFLLNGVLIHEGTENLTLIVESDFGSESNVPNGGAGGTPINARWYGLAGWSLYSITERLTGVYRAEVFRDDGGVRTGYSDTYYEMTLGLVVKPKTWFWVRPEIRFDWASGAPPYDGGTKSSQLTLGFDTIFLF